MALYRIALLRWKTRMALYRMVVLRWETRVALYRIALLRWTTRMALYRVVVLRWENVGNKAAPIEWRYSGSCWERLFQNAVVACGYSSMQ